MSRRLRGQRGMSLVEVTIILLVLMLLTAVLAPSIFDFVNDAKTVKVKEDCESIGIAVARLTRDVGPCLKFTASTACTKSNRVDMLHSDGPDVTSADLGTLAVNYSAAGLIQTDLNWQTDDTRGDSMEDQFVKNAPAYTTPGGFTPPSWLTPIPSFNLGWRGAYLAPPIGNDPWGKRYLVNSVYLTVATDATAGTGEGQASGGWDHDVFCISASFNTRYETFFGGSNPFTGGTERQGDDFIYVISGGTR